MGFFKKAFKKAKAEGEKLMGSEEPPKNPPTRWEKAVVGLNGIVKSVSQIDPDGVDVVCVPGTGGQPDVYRNIKDVTGLEAMVSSKEPGGPCHMGEAMDLVLKEAFERGFAERPTSVLVLTAGRPDDHEALSQSIAEAAKKVDKDSDLTITFVQVGDDEWAENYLKHLDTELTCTSASGETIDLVDTVKDEEIKKAVGEMKENKGGAGALMGAFAGAAMGVGGMYLYNKMNAKKRTEGWNGKWKVTYEGDEVMVLTVKDDMAGNLTIEGFPDDLAAEGTYEDANGAFNIQFTDPTGSEEVFGTVEDEHHITWSDGTCWEEVPPEGSHWSHYVAAGTAGAAASGATGYLLQKKFFNKASNKVPSDYVIIMDRSQMMAVPDTGK